MVKTFARVVSLAAVFFVAQGAFAEQVLYWMVEDDAMVTSWDGSSTQYIADFLGAAEDGSYFAARVRVTGGGISGDMFLNIYNVDTGEEWEGDCGIDLSENNGGNWGFGVPEGVQSPSGDYSSGSPEYSFIIELGNVANDEWTTLAQSASKTYLSLAEHIASDFNMSPLSGTPWSPKAFTAVPEPSGGLMMALGLALLALKRRRG